MRGVIMTLNHDGTRFRQEVNYPLIKKEIQYAVGSSVGIVPGFDKFAYYDCIAFHNEDGKYRELPLNGVATSLWHECLKRKGIKTREYIAGNVAVVYGDKAFMAKMIPS